MMNIFDIAAALNDLERVKDAPSTDVYWINTDELRSLQVAYRDERFNPLVSEPDILIPCTYRCKTYLMDERADLWHFDAHGFLSPVSVGYYEGVDGVVTDLLEQDDLKPEFREHLQRYLKTPEDKG